MNKKDHLYQTEFSSIPAFEFNKKVVEVFPDMINRSVPGYEEIITLTGILASDYITENSQIYDLGCSLGASSFSIRHQTKVSAHLIAIDNSSDMIIGCEKHLNTQKSPVTFTTKQADLLTITIKNASVVVVNFALQFVKLSKRDLILQKIYQGLNSNGVLIIAEKTCFNDKTEQKNLEKWHTKFKKANGYSDLEIAQKRSALEKVLISDTELMLLNRLKNAGFSNIQKWFQAFNFQAFLAKK